MLTRGCPVHGCRLLLAGLNILSQKAYSRTSVQQEGGRGSKHHTIYCVCSGCVAWKNIIRVNGLAG